MRLRKTITIPTRFEEEDPLPAKSRNGTRPTYPALLKEQVIPFNPNHPPAAFPSLSLKAKDASDHVQIETESECSFHDSCSGREGLPTDILGDINATPVFSDEHEPVPYPNTNLPLDKAYNLARDDEFDEHDDPTLVDMMPPPLHDPNDTSISEQDEVHSMDYYLSTWNALPLSLQSHIYIVLSQKYSPKSVSKVLGLTESEFDKIQKAIRLRSLYPASLSEIWEYANQLSNSIPGLPASTSIDVNTLNECMDYLIFASNYAFAFESEVRNARNFLASRGMASDLLGTWLPDPSEPEGSQCLVNVPGIMGRASLPAIDVHDDSGYSSMSEGDRDVSHTQGYSSLSTGTSRLELNADKYAHERGFAQAERPDFVNAHSHLSGGSRKLGYPGTLLTTKAPRHPLSIVTKPDESPVQRKNGVQAMEIDSSIDFDLSVAREYAFDPDSTLVLLQKDMTDMAQSAVRDTEVQCNSSCKETSAEDIPEQCGTSTERSSNTPLAAVEEASEDTTMPGRPNPHHLVLRIQNKDGLARIMRNGPKSTDTHNPAHTKEPELPAYPSGYDKHHSAEVAPLRPLNVNTKMSSFSKALIESALHASKEITTSSKSNYLPFLALGTPTKPRSFPTFLNKRKASQTDIYPASPKTQRTLTHSQLSSPRNGLVTEEDSNNIDLRHSQAKQPCNPRLSSSRTSSEISTPTKYNVEITEFVASQSAEAHSSSRSPRSPSYSPISENEELEEFQALIRGPKAPNLSIKVPTPNMELAPPKTLSSTPTPGLSLLFQQGVTLKPPGLSGSSQHAVQHPSTPVSFHAAESAAEADTPSSPNEVGDLVAAPMPKIKLVVRRPSSTLDTADDAKSKEAKSAPSSILQSEAREHEIVDDFTAVSTPTPNQEEEPKSKPAKRARPKKEILQPEAKAQAKALPKKRGPRGPYRKTKERLAREEQERTMQNEQDQNQAEQAAHPQHQEAQPEQAPQQELITRKKKAPMF
ncbi:hypothetical protein LTR10_013200 [Elasticomyces elasticus]|uniref:Uncharacterized protein n=1 Tax=Exophiala sideris TaxID=1016849 RepID=A0ABR0JBC8_9EURO|nr:hypothetical protein LTR10_013200 [Elasticomyces elasticus]KAK5030575.1 hypothetical protein LTS07_005359 [Exophiala sideris]KAK5038629.1 hypothetical protein LTR13_004376 [Exophiala sideris]KAK5060510.1 hypothetical protein LTR69_005827 [Exophiala sideris]KAK5183422.1 hypothetical protein LTR44_004423 [Eurotiomycetes sp. CCFEE 6388]